MSEQPISQLNTCRERLFLTVMGTLTGLLLSVSANIFYECLNSGKDSAQSELPVPGLGFTLGPLALAAILAIASLVTGMLTISSARKALLSTRATIWREDAASKTFPAVIFSLSITRREMIAKALACLEGEPIKTTLDRKRILDMLCDKKGDFAGWNWQQPLRLIRHNHDALKSVYVITTEEAWVYFGDFRQLVTRLLLDGAEVRAIEKTADRDDYNQLTEALDCAIDHARKELDFDYPQICIDTTGGTAVYSAAATVKALNSDIMLSYFGSFGGNNEGKAMIFRPSIRN